MLTPSKRFAPVAVGTSLLLPILAACTRDNLPISATVAAAIPSAQGSAPNRFPFPLPATGNAPGSLVDLSALNPAPIAEPERLVAKNGHYYTPSGRRVRFLAISMGASDLFPTHAEAEQVAQRLHRFGVNMVRLHHMDATWTTPNIFYFDGGNTHEKPMIKLDPQSLERFDYLVAQFKKNGIYVDLNLHVVRPWNAAMGFPDANKINQEGKVVSYFEPKAIQLQRQYVHDIITHVNQYTKQSYAADPVVAAMEITNEDTLLGAADTIPTLPAHYQDVLKTEWNAYLAKKYGTTIALKTAWASAAKPLGKEMIAGGQFASGTTGWTFEHQEQSASTTEVESAAGQTNAPEGKVLHVSGIKRSSQDWHLQLHATGLDFKEGETYTVSFTAKASAPRTVGVNTRYDRAPWTMVGLDQSVSLTPQWKRYTLSFVAHKPDPQHNRLSFVYGNSATDFFLGDISVRPGGGGSVVPAGQTIEAKSVEMVPVSASPSGTDFAAYLLDTERAFADSMYHLIKTDLKARSIVWCSQASYGGFGGTWREANMDSVDMHSYWEHPSFPGTPFDANNYRTENKPMVKQDGLGTLDGLANHRVAGKPFTVTEYNHPAPNEYMAEAIPIIFSYAAWQDWDGIFLFAYGGEATGKINAFFDVTNDPALMAYLPAAANLFLRGDLAPSPQTMTLSVPIPLIPKLKAEGSDYAFYSTAGPLPDGASFWTHRAAIDFNNTRIAKPVVRLQGSAPASPPLVWDHSAGIYTVNTANTRAIIGFVGGRPTTAGGVTLAANTSARNFAVLTVTSRDNKTIEKSGSLLVTLMDKAENPGAEWNTERTFAAHAWEKGPVEIEGVTGTLTIPTTAKSATVYALDSSGKRGATIPATVTNGKLSFAVSPTQGTVWYEVVR